LGHENHFLGQSAARNASWKWMNPFSAGDNTHSAPLKNVDSSNLLIIRTNPDPKPTAAVWWQGRK